MNAPPANCPPAKPPPAKFPPANPPPANPPPNPPPAKPPPSPPPPRPPKPPPGRPPPRPVPPPKPPPKPPPWASRSGQTSTMQARLVSEATHHRWKGNMSLLPNLYPHELIIFIRLTVLQVDLRILTPFSGSSIRPKRSQESGRGGFTVQVGEGLTTPQATAAAKVEPTERLGTAGRRTPSRFPYRIGLLTLS